MPSTFSIQYLFMTPGNREERFSIDIDSETLELIRRPPEKVPSWAEMDFHQCPNCPLSMSDYFYCPLCLGISPIVGQFEAILSYDTVEIEVKTNERRFIQETTVQRGLSALMGLVMAVSGCPHTAFFKPMARFHLPFSTEEETAYRVSSMHMLAQYYIKELSGNTEIGLGGLSNIYQNIHHVNMSIAKRLRAATSTDSSVNAVVMLDMFTKSIPYNIDESMEVIRYLFRAYLENMSQVGSTMSVDICPMVGS